MQVLIDTCVWSQVLRRTDGSNHHAYQLRDIISDNRACIIGSIRQEILSGIRIHLNHREDLTAFLNVC